MTVRIPKDIEDRNWKIATLTERLKIAHENCSALNRFMESGFEREERTAGRIAELERELAQAQEDTARLGFMFGDLHVARAEIDAARRLTQTK